MGWATLYVATPALALLGAWAASSRDGGFGVLGYIVITLFVILPVFLGALVGTGAGWLAARRRAIGSD